MRNRPLRLSERSSLPPEPESGIVERAIDNAPAASVNPTDRSPDEARLNAVIGGRVRERRETINMTQGQLARQLGLTFSQIQKYEKGSSRIGAGRLLLIAQPLGVPVTYFFEGLDPLSISKVDVGPAGGSREL